MFDKELFEKICTDYGIELVESHEQGITLTDSTKVYKSEEDLHNEKNFRNLELNYEQV